jgi:hypothetical protein
LAVFHVGIAAKNTKKTLDQIHLRHFAPQTSSEVHVNVPTHSQAILNWDTTFKQANN